MLQADDPLLKLRQAKQKVPDQISWAATGDHGIVKIALYSRLKSFFKSFFKQEHVYIHTEDKPYR